MLALRAGLMRDQHRAEQPLGLALDVVDGFHDLDAAGLAAAAGMDLRLHDPYRTAELARGLAGFSDGKGRQPARHRHTELRQQSFRLVLVDVHAIRAATCGLEPFDHFARLGAILMQASTRPCTAATDLSNMTRSALSSSISTMRSTPLAPSTTGTPT